MICRVCQKEFTPNKYHPNQQVCLQPACQRIRQIQNLKAWRMRNADYFKYLGQEKAWQEKRRGYNRLWKAANKEYLRQYAQSHKEQRRAYMREYMRQHR
jgi:hypothetical protein